MRVVTEWIDTGDRILCTLEDGSMTEVNRLSALTRANGSKQSEPWNDLLTAMLAEEDAPVADPEPIAPEPQPEPVAEVAIAEPEPVAVTEEGG